MTAVRGPRHTRRGERDHHDEFYAGDAERIFSSPLYGRLLAAHTAFLRDVMADCRHGAVLSIGCGDGRRELAMADAVGTIVGIDLSAVGIEQARRRADRAGVRTVEFRVGDATDLTGAAASFDAVWCAGILHHLTEERMTALLHACWTVLRDGGRFVSMDPNAGRIVNLFKPLVRRRYARYHSDAERELRPAAVVELVRRAGFADAAIHFTDAFISPLAWLCPAIGEPLAAGLARIDRLVVRAPLVRRWSSGFAVVARKR